MYTLVIKNYRASKSNKNPKNYQIYNMFNISSFLEKISKNINSQELDIQKICDVIFDKTNIICKPESIKIQNNILFLEVSPGVKNKIFMNKQDILEVLSNSTTKIIDIR